MRLLILSWVVLFIAVTPVAAQDTAINPALEAHFALIEETTQQIRALKPIAPIVRDFPTREELGAYIETLLATDFSEEDMQRTVQFYAAFDLLPIDTDLRAVIQDLLTDQIGGFYDPETGVMNVILLSGEQPEDELPLLEQIVYSHEYIHALQDQHFDLVGIGLSTEDSLANPDGTLAVQALIEGDATLGMTEFLNQIVEENPFTAFELLTQSFATGNLTLPPGTPDILEEELLYPYEEGLVFTSRLYSEGGWPAVNNAFVELPVSTEQILHPERYLAGDEPQEISLAPTQAALNDEWTLVWDRTLGEFYLTNYLKTQLPRPDAQAAATGWGGDRYHIYHNATTNELAWVLRLSWDTTDDFVEFTNAYERFADARFGASRQGDCWLGVTDVLCTVTDGEDNLIALAPTQEQALALLNSQR
ncbi:MAG: hypothetical protein D6737_12685 [Chloroflexi bacterium]|nr:MAG: hypothetical protein D6737_12685 [Chloroflexota bacterium]